MPAGLAFTPDCGQTAAGRLYNCPAEDEMRTALQKAIDDADYECGRRMNELDFATAFASPMQVAKKRAGAFNTVRLSSAARLWIVDTGGGDDEHAMPDAELAKELTGQTLAARKARFSTRVRTDIPYSALLRATFATKRQLEDLLEAGKEKRLEAARAAKLRGQPYARCTWRETCRQHEDARQARASLDAHRAAAAQTRQLRVAERESILSQPQASPPATLVVSLAQRPRLHDLIPRGDARRAIGAEQEKRIARM